MDTFAVPQRVAIVRFVIGVFDVVLTTVGLLFLLPVFIILAIVIRSDSPGSVLFKQKRVGMFGREFWFFKFRSMVVNAEALRDALTKENEASGPLFKMKNDPRITRIGRVLRKYSLDELPQLINVSLRDMSLVGPRPALPSEVALYNTPQLRRLDVKPGITGLWQISGRSDLSFERAIELDIEYVERQSLFLYVIILIRTIPAVLLGRGAY
jgi:lipopolysaccharide/colanic/teichoic acid biosynthesis glycosyltransferase